MSGKPRESRRGRPGREAQHENDSEPCPGSGAGAVAALSAATRGHAFADRPVGLGGFGHLLLRY